jgi:hypothetical protein
VVATVVVVVGGVMHLGQTVGASQMPRLSHIGIVIESSTRLELRQKQFCVVNSGSEETVQFRPVAVH